MANVTLQLNENETYNLLLALSDSIAIYERIITNEVEHENSIRENLLELIELREKMRDHIRATNWEL